MRSEGSAARDAIRRVRGGLRLHAQKCRPSAATRGVLLGITVATLVSACHLLLDAEVEQCAVDADCDRRGGPFVGRRCVDRICRALPLDGGDSAPAAVADAALDPRRACFGKTVWPAEDPGNRVRYRQRFARVVSGQPIVGLWAEACGLLDPTCLSPVDRGATTEKGDLVLSIPRGFRGYLHMPDGGSLYPSMMPHMYNVLPPPAVDSDLAIEPGEDAVWNLVSREELDGLVQVIGAAVDPERGHLLAQTIGCDGAPLPGMAVRSSNIGSSTIAYYFKDGTPTIGSTRTDSSGLLGFINVDPGVATITGEVAETGERLGEYAVLVKRGTVTIVELHPSP